MNAETILHSDVLDILFENRNKQYGAYQLRKGYDKRLVKAMSLIILLVLLFCIADYIQHRWNKNNSSTASSFLVIDTIKLTPYVMPKTPSPPAVLKPQAPVASVPDTPPLIVQDNLVTDKNRVPTIDDLADKTSSNTGSDGPVSNSDNSSPSPQAPTAAVAPQPAPAAEPAIVDLAEVMPEFPGGTPALLRFLGKNLQVPEDALEPGQKVRVPVKFVVNRDGNLSNVEFLTQADNIFKKEILRVVAKMPKWKPGSTHGKTVAVYFTIPVIFDMAEN